MMLMRPFCPIANSRIRHFPELKSRESSGQKTQRTIFINNGLTTTVDA